MFYKIGSADYRCKKCTYRFLRRSRVSKQSRPYSIPGHSRATSGAMFLSP